MDDQPVCDEMAKFAPLGSFLGGNTQAVQAHTTLDKAVSTLCAWECVQMVLPEVV